MKKYLIILIISLAVINIVTLFYFSRYKETQSLYLEALQPKLEQAMSMQENMEAGFQNNCMKLDSVTCLDKDGNSIDLRSLFSNERERILICRFSELDCESCISYSIRKIQEHTGDIGKENILFVASYFNNKMLEPQMKLYGIDSFAVLNAKDLSIPIEDWNKPYYCVLDSSLQISDLFIPSKTASHIQQIYFDSIVNKYFSKAKDDENKS